MLGRLAGMDRNRGATRAIMGGPTKNQSSVTAQNTDPGGADGDAIAVANRANQTTISQKAAEIFAIRATPSKTSLV